jgi:hypothetical protein
VIDLISCGLDSASCWCFVSFVLKLRYRSKEWFEGWAVRRGKGALVRAHRSASDCILHLLLASRKYLRYILRETHVFELGFGPYRGLGAGMHSIVLVEEGIRMTLLHAVADCGMSWG